MEEREAAACEAFAEEAPLDLPPAPDDLSVAMLSAPEPSGPTFPLRPRKDSPDVTFRKLTPTAEETRRVSTLA